MVEDTETENVYTEDEVDTIVEEEVNRALEKMRMQHEGEREPRTATRKDTEPTMEFSGVTAQSIKGDDRTWRERGLRAREVEDTAMKEHGVRGKYSTGTPRGMGSPPFEAQRALKGMDYPAGKDEIIEHARLNGAPDEIMKLLKTDLEDKTYHNSADVSAQFKGDRGNVYKGKTVREVDEEEGKGRVERKSRMEELNEERGQRR
jgi:hypothetical protein